MPTRKEDNLGSFKMVMEHVVNRRGAFKMNENQFYILPIPKVYFIWGGNLKSVRISWPFNQFNLHHHF